MYRHFIEYLVRAVYLKNAGEQDLPKTLERIILTKFKQVYEQKKIKMN